MEQDSSNLSEVAQLCQQMVRIPSVNPQDKTDLPEPYGEVQMADFVCGWFDSCGLGPIRQQVVPGRDNIVVSAEGKDNSKSLLLSSHMDTVDVKDMTIEPFSGYIADGRIYGRGACDVKGALAAMMIAFRDRVKAGDLPYNLALVATCGEEYNMLGARHLAEHLPGKPAGAVFAEPTSHKVVVSHRGVVRLQLTCHGKSGHSSRPETGVNAIYIIAKAIAAIEEFIERLTDSRGHPDLGCESAAVTTISGGQQVNVIPDRCRVRIDWRTLPERTGEACRAELAEFLRAKLPDENFDLELLNTYSPMHTDPEHRLVGALLNAAENIAQTRQKSFMTGATDASAFASFGIPTPIFGPGNTAQAHTQDEYVEIAELEKGLAAYKTYLAGDWGI